MGKCAHGIERFPELNRVAWLKTLPKWSVGAEIGVRAAKFSRRILRTVKPSLLWLVDCWSTQPKVPYNLSDECYLSDMRKALRRVRGEILSGVVRVVCGFSREVVELVPDKSLDWLYVDAGHTYMECHEDLCLWFKCYLGLRLPIPAFTKRSKCIAHEYVLIIHRPIHSATCGTTAFPSPLS
ncbi:hypothetical protein LCGC14_2075270, partial [marine sediment metagenome]